MDPLSALSVAASVVQFVDFGYRLLVRTWEMYRDFEGEDEKDAVQLMDELSYLTATLTESSERFRTENPGSAAATRLQQAQIDCGNLSREMKKALEKISRRRQGVRSETKVVRFILAGMWDNSRIEAVKDRLGSLERSVMSSLLLCIWSDSKKTAQWATQFSRQLEDMSTMVQRLQELTGMIDQQATVPVARPYPAASHLVQGQTIEKLVCEPDSGMLLWSTDRPAVTLAEDLGALEHLISAGKSRLLSKVEEGLFITLNSVSTESNQIRAELVQSLWDRNWIVHDSMTGYPTAAKSAWADTKDIAVAMSKTLCFVAIEAREEAVAEVFRGTYEWIFSRPKIQHGKLMWSSFPEWLQGSLKDPYWITGKPGSGKSTIMKFIAKHESLQQNLSTWAGGLPVLVATYYAWNSGLDMQKSWEGLKRTILTQALENHPELASRISPRRWTLVHALRDLECSPSWESWEVDESFGNLVFQCGATIKIVLLVDGLDEFEMPPTEVVSHIRELTQVSAKGLRICVASRPWIEFDDSFSESPTLQMHLLTQDDMIAFVRGGFSENRGYAELSNIYPQQTLHLVDDIVTKADGVFFWVHLVVRTLLDAMSEGEPLATLQATLDQLPTDISDLFDTIWARIPSRLLHDASIMIRLVQAAHGPLPWMTLWLTDESRHGTVINMHNFPPDRRAHAQRNLKRRLATRTRGILELTVGREVRAGFAHRTARDWALQSSVWTNICSLCSADFDPYMVLLRAETLHLTDVYSAKDHSHSSFWEVVMKSLWYAGQARPEVRDVQKLIQYLDQFDVAAKEAYSLAQTNWPTSLRVELDKLHWSSKQNPAPARLGLRNSFLGLAAQFSLLPYIKEQARLRKGFKQRATEDWLGLFENAVFGYGYYMSTVFLPPNGLVTISQETRLETVVFLLGKGVEHARVHTIIGMAPLKDEVRRMVSQSRQDQEYYSQVLEKLEKKRYWAASMSRLRRHV